MKNVLFRSPFFVLTAFFSFMACQQNTTEKNRTNKYAFSAGLAHEQKAFAFQSEGLMDSAFVHFSEARKCYEKVPDSARIVYVLLTMGSIQYQYNDFAEMQTTMVEALKYLGKDAPKAYEPIIYNNLGMAYCQLEDYPRAIESYEKTLSFSDVAVHKLTARNNIGYTYISSGNYKNAFDVLQEVYASPNISDSLSLKARVADNLGYCAYKLEMPDGIKLLTEGAAIREKIGDEFGLITSKLHLGEALLEDDKEKAIALVKEAEQLAAKTNSADDRLLALHFLATNSPPALGQKFSIRYFKISDSLQTVRRKARNYFAEVKYNYKRERDQKLRAQANEARLKLRQSELENARLIWLIAAICVVFVAAVVIFLIMRRNKRIRWKAAYDAEIRISNRMHDEMANDLHQTIVFAEINDLSEAQNRNRLLDSLDTVYQRVRGISRENAAVDQMDFAEKLKELISYYGSPEQKILAKGMRDIAWTAFSEKQKVAVHRTIQELLVNMKKHSKCATALLQFSSDGKNLFIGYSDNGVGVAGPPVSKNGLSIMENRIRDLNGTVTFDNAGKGFRVNIEFPI